MFMLKKYDQKYSPSVYDFFPILWSGGALAASRGSSESYSQNCGNIIENNVDDSFVQQIKEAAHKGAMLADAL